MWTNISTNSDASVIFNPSTSSSSPLICILFINYKAFSSLCSVLRRVHCEAVMFMRPGLICARALFLCIRAHLAWVKPLGNSSRGPLLLSGLKLQLNPQSRQALDRLGCSLDEDLRLIISHAVFVFCCSVADMGNTIQCA